MADNLRIRQPLDAKKVNTHEEWEITYWTNKWGITKAQLLAAVKAVGNDAAKIAAHLGKKA